MTSQTSRPTAWRRAAIGAVASGALVVGMWTGAPLALSDPEAPPADPASPITPGPANRVTPGGTAAGAAAGALPGEMTADQALSIIASDYDTGAGGGKLSQLIHSVLKLRSQGFYPSQGNRDAIVAALDKRPNQVPLIAALEQTLAFQRRNQQRGIAAANPAPSVGINQAPTTRRQHVPADPGDSGDPSGDTGLG